MLKLFSNVQSLKKQAVATLSASRDGQGCLQGGQSPCRT